METKTKIPLGNVVRFPLPERPNGVCGNATLAHASWDHCPLPEESLRIMRARVAIKNRQLRADLIEMLEGASRTRGQAPSPKK